MKLLIAGEGPTELGDWAHHPSYRANPPNKGVLESLLEKLRAEGWQICDGWLWKKVSLYKAGGFRRPEARKVIRLLQLAELEGFDAVAFSRDRDGDEQRECEVERGIREGVELVPSLRVIGGVAVEDIEAWLLALLGERGSESHSHPKQVLAAEPHSVTSREEKVELVLEAEVEAIPEDARSLLRWLERAREALDSER